MMKIFQVDAFTDTKFKGNPAAVCLLPESKRQSEAWMQNLAEEMNVSETAYAQKIKKNNYSLRWFTPTTEVNLCGHATLATAHILWSENYVDKSSLIQFDTLSGEITVSYDDGLISLDFPVESTNECKESIGLEMALGCNIINTYLSEMSMLVEVKDEETIRKLTPNIQQLELIPSELVIVTSRGDEVDYVCRVFGPNVGINEDPVTGSANCSLAPFWAERLEKTKMKVLQLSNRGGALQVELEGGRVNIAGHATTIFKGDLYG